MGAAGHAEEAPAAPSARRKRGRGVWIPVGAVLTILTGGGAGYAGQRLGAPARARAEEARPGPTEDFAALEEKIRQLRRDVDAQGLDLKDVKKDVGGLMQESHDREQREKTLREVEARVRDLDRPGRIR